MYNLLQFVHLCDIIYFRKFYQILVHFKATCCSSKRKERRFLLRETIIKRVLAAVFALSMMIGVIGLIPPMTVSADTVEAKAVSRMINVVYDDSNSMLTDQRLWWCYAKYSLEVFSSMMQDNDTMNIYYMSAHMPSAMPEPDKKPTTELHNLSGDRSQQQKNIDAIHNNVPYTRGTPFGSIKKAYSDLKSVSGYDEKWLVVITDGDSFDGGENAVTLDNQFADCNSHNIKVVYLAIGSDMVPTANESRGIYVYKADGNIAKEKGGILQNVTSICQRIFQRPELESATSSKLVLDVPVSEIIVFAQGENVSIGNLNGARKVQSSVKMKKEDAALATTTSKYVGTVVGADLYASVVTFLPQSGSYISEGTYDLNISADEYVVYYKPCLDVLLEMMDEKGNKVTDKYIPMGSYSLQYWLTYPKGHPKHGEKIDQNLFNVDYYLTCEVDGSVRNLNSLNVDLGEGETTIKVLAKYLNFSSSDAAIKYVVEDFTINELEIELEYLQQDYRLSTLERDNEGILVKVSKGGQPIPTAEWEAYRLTCSIDNPEFKTVKNADSTFTVYPQYKNDSKTETATGDIAFNITVYASNDHRTTDSGTVEASINIYDDVNAAPIGITVEEQRGELDSKNFTAQDSTRKVTIDWNGQPLTPEQYEALKLAVEVNDRDYAATITLDPYVPGEPTTATVSFELVPNKKGEMPKPIKLHGTKKITVTAEIENEGQLSTGEAKFEMNVKDGRSLLEKIIGWLIALVVFLIILGYIPGIKKYLPRKTYYAYGSSGVRSSAALNWYKSARFFSVIIPYRAVRSTVSLSRADIGVTLEVKSRGGKKVSVTNADKILDYNGIKLRFNRSEISSKKKINLTSTTIETATGRFVAKLQGTANT